jgi:hypothetical protein
MVWSYGLNYIMSISLVEMGRKKGVCTCKKVVLWVRNYLCLYYALNNLVHIYIILAKCPCFATIVFLATYIVQQIYIRVYKNSTCYLQTIMFHFG